MAQSMSDKACGCELPARDLNKLFKNVGFRINWTSL